MLERFHNLSSKVVPLLGVIALAISMIFGSVGTTLGSSSSSNRSPSDGEQPNVVFRVLDQYGLPRSCRVEHDLPPRPPGIFFLDRGILQMTDAYGIYAEKREPGTTVSVTFKCDWPDSPHYPQTATAELTAPEHGVAWLDVVIENPARDASSSEGSSK